MPYASSGRIPTIGSSMTSRATRSGAATARWSPMRPPIEWPTTATLARPSASSTSRRSATCCSTVHGGSHVDCRVAAQVGGEHAPVGQALVREAEIAAPVPRDAVQRQERWRAVGPEAVHVQHLRGH